MKKYENMTDEEYKALYERVNKDIEQMKDKGNISDGYHTFNELYEHRHALFGAFIQLNGGWKSKLHSDGTMYEGWFIAGTEINGKQISYHLPMRLWDDFPAIEKEKAPVWDEHTPEDVVNRLKEFWRDYNKKDFGSAEDFVKSFKHMKFATPITTTNATEEQYITIPDVITEVKTSGYLRQVPEYYMKEIKVGIYEDKIVKIDWEKLQESKAYKMNVEEVIKYLEETVEFLKK